MKRLFTERARLVVYLEMGDLNRLTEKARGDGQTVVEWAREKLLGELGDNSDVRRPAAVRVAERRAGVAERVEAPVLAAGERAKKTCKHGVEKGYHCWQCRGVAE